MVAEPVSMGSESLLEQLSRDVCRLRARARQVLLDLGRSRNPGLCARLQRELAVLLGRREQLRQLCVQLRSSSGSAWAGSLSLELLEELCRRPLLGA